MRIDECRLQIEEFTNLRSDELTNWDAARFAAAHSAERASQFFEYRGKCRTKRVPWSPAAVEVKTSMRPECFSAISLD